jgi:NTE family protein
LLGWSAAASLTAALGSGCDINADRDHTGADAPSAAPLPRQPGVAWVFSSGGPRGFVHIGVLKALDELGVVPDLLVGASVGSLVAVLRAGGLDGLELERLALQLSPLSLARVARLLGGEGERLSGSAVADLVREQLLSRGPTARLEALPLMAVCVAHRLGPAPPATVAFSRGDAGLAVQASSAIEGQFTPVRIRGQRHVDADLHMPLPVRLARQLGALRVLAVDASAHEQQAPPGAERYRSGDLRKRALTQPDADAADLLLHPHFGYWVSLSQEFRQRAIEAGYRATLAQGARIQALHAS